MNKMKHILLGLVDFNLVRFFKVLFITIEFIVKTQYNFYRMQTNTNTKNWFIFKKKKKIYI